MMVAMHTPSGADEQPPAADAVELTRDLGFWDITLIGVGAMIGAGVFVLVGSAAGRAGPALVLAFVINGIVAILTALVYAEVGSALPSAGGSFVFIRQALPPLFGFMAGWMSWFAHAVAGSLYALGFGSFTVEILRVGGLELGELALFSTLPAQAPEVLLGILVGLFFFYINFRGASETGKAGAIVTVAKVAAILLFCGGGLWVLLRSPERLGSFQPFAPNGIGGVFLAMGITYIAFEGFEVIVQAGEEVQDPKRNVPKAVITAMVIVIPLYLLVSVVLIGAIDPPDGEGAVWQWLGEVKELGLARAASQVIPYGNIVILLGGLLSTMSALNATTYSSTRVSFAMGRDRFLPPLFARIHPGNRTPHMALAVTGALILFMLVALPLESVAASASLMFLLLFLMVNFSSVFIRRRYGDKLAYGYLTPFFPAVPVAAVLIQLVLANYMLHFSVDVLATAVIWLGLGGVIYAAYSRHHELAKVPTPVVLEERPILEEGYDRPPVVLPIARPRGAEGLARTAAAMARTMDRHVLVLHVATVPEQLPISAGNELVAEARQDMAWLMEVVRDEGARAELLIRIAHDPATAIVRTLNASRADFCVMGWRGRSRGPNRILGSNLDVVLRDANSNFVVMQDLPDRADRILLPASNPVQAQIAFAVAYGLAQRLGAREIDVVTLFSPSADREELEALGGEVADGLAEAAGLEVRRWDEPVEMDGIRLRFLRERVVSGPRERLVAMSRDYDAMVLGAGPGGPWGRNVLGRLSWRLAREAHCPVVVVKRRTGTLHFQLQSFFQFFREEEGEVGESGDAGETTEGQGPGEPGSGTS